jgi:hypothetical protein
VAVIDRTVGGILGFLGVVCLLEAHKVWNGWDGTGLLPLLLGVVLVVLMLVLICAPSAEIRGQVFDWAETRHVVILSGAFALYVALVSWLGYALSTWLFLAGVARYVSPWPFATTLIWTGATAMGTYLVFRKFLGMYLPAGLFCF